VSAENRDLVLTRTFDASRERIFVAWTDARQLARWWGPHGFTNPVCEVDPRPGGSIRIVMRAPDGTEYPMQGEFREIGAPDQLVFIATVVHDAMGSPGLATVNTITLREENRRTTLTLQAQVLSATPAAAQAIAGMNEGWSQSLDRLSGFIDVESQPGRSTYR